MEVETWADLEQRIKNMTPEQKSQRVQVCLHSPNAYHVNDLRPVVLVDTIAELGLQYCRSSVDNKHHDEEIVIYVDGNPFGEDGAKGYMYQTPEDLFDNKGTPIYPKTHDESSDWTGPAQKIRDSLSGKDRDDLYIEVAKKRIKQHDKLE